jgi:hypothetical protein
MTSSKTLSALDKVGAIGAFLAASAAPCCFPLLAAVGAGLGLGLLRSWLGYMDYAIQGFALVSVVGNVFAFRQHHRVLPFAIALLSAAAIFFAFYVNYQISFIYAGLGGLSIAAIWNIFAKHQARPCCDCAELRSTITCPHCGHQKVETMPTDACLYFHECPNCHVTLRPKPGDCCIFCSYGSIKCPPMQTGNSCCAS